MSYFPPCTIDGRTIDLVHLEPFAVAFAIKSLGRSLTIDVKFSNHCYTTAFDPAVHHRSHIVMDGRRERAFDPERFDLSRRLPGMIRSLPDGPVWLTASDRNYVYVARLAADDGRSYPMFFHLKRLRDVAPRNLSMMVESAYPVTDVRAVLAGATKISFPVLCAKVFKGEPIRPRARR